MMDDGMLGLLACLIFGVVIMLIYAASENTSESHSMTKCDHEWEYDGENGSKAGAFYKCKKCGANKYIPYKELMAMSEEDYEYWSTRPNTQEEQYRQEFKKKEQNEA